MEQVSWEDAQVFLKRLAEQAQGRLLYRLPTEAEWEYACRGGHLIREAGDGHTLPFHFDRPTSSLSTRQANFDGSSPYGAAPERRDLNRPCRVGSYEPNRLGLYDMHGNIRDVCLDWYGEGYYAASPSADPPGPASGSTRVQRGGSWFSDGRWCRAANRDGNAPSERNEYLGFRAAAAPPSRPAVRSVQ